MTGNPEAINFYFESVPTNAPVFTIHFHLPDLSRNRTCAGLEIHMSHKWVNQHR
jgi:hypothetical protein